MISLLMHLSPLLLGVAMSAYFNGNDDCPQTSTMCDKPCVPTHNPTACSCPHGYRPQAGVCKDINECDDKSADCDYICHNHAGNFSCSCGNYAWLAEDKRSCIYDLRLCYQFQSTCGDGYTVSSQGTCCLDVDECSTTSTNCNATTEFCLNMPGSYECRCLQGFSAFGSNCQDIDECTDSLHWNTCNTTTENCVNTYGSFRCECLPGLMRNLTGDCADIDECSLGTDKCEYSCNNTVGSYTCSCQPGYTLDANLYSCIVITTSATTTADTTNTTEASKTVRQDFECHLNYMHVFIPVELVPNSQLTLRELNCRLLNNGTHHKISFDYDECGTSQSFFEDYISIDNEVNVHNILNNTAEITFVEDYTIPLKCLVDRSKHVNGAIQVISRESIHENAVQSTDFHMKEFTTKDYDLEITAYPIQLPINREIFFEVALTNSSSNSTGIFVEKCEATPSIHRNGTVRVSLVNFGCSVNPAVKVLPAPEIDRFRFSIQAFHFSGPENVDNMVYVHCSASTCGGVMCDNTCPKSSRRRRRSTRGQASATLTSGSHVVG